MSTDRKYFRSNGTSPANPGFGSPWDAASPGVFYQLVDDPTNTPITTMNTSTSGISGIKQIGSVGWVSNPLPSDALLDGSMVFRMRAREGSATNDAHLALQVLVISEDGGTIRGQLFYGYAAAELTNVLTATDIQGTLDAVEAQAGDRIAVLVGFHINNVTTGANSNEISMGDLASASDLALGSQVANRPYIEFTWDDPPSVPLNLNTSLLAPKSFEVSWDEPAGGTVPTGYEIRLDDRPPILLGLVNEHTFSNLDDDTVYIVQVRTRTNAQYSPWVSHEVRTPPLVQIVKWDDPDKRLYQTGCDRGAIYFDDGSAVAWNGLTGVDETGTGTASVLYRDGNIYYSDIEPSDFTATIKAFFWPDEFGRCLGIPEITDGLYVDNQKPRKFNFTYRNLIGSGGRGDRFGYQIHLVYNALANIGTRTRKTRTNQVTLDEFTFDIIATPVKMPGLRPSAHYIIDTRTMDKPTIEALEEILYSEGRLPEPQELYDLMNFGDAITFIDHGDGTWTARGSSENLIDHGDGTWTIKNVNGTDNGDGTFTLEDTPG